MGTGFAFPGDMNKHPREKAKPATQAAHPETQNPRDKTGVPGSESSKAQGHAKDVRSAHDKDGNSQQSGR